MRHLAWIAFLFPAQAFAEVATIIKTGGITDVVSLEKEGTGFAGYLTTAHAVGVAAVAAIAVVMIVWGAIGIFGENVWGKTKGKERVQNAILGLLLAAGSYVILKTISDSLVSADFTLDSSLGADGTTGATLDGSSSGSSSSGSSSSGTTGSTSGSTGTAGTTGETSSNRPWTGEGGDYSIPSGLTDAEYDDYVRTEIFEENGIGVNNSYGISTTGKGVTNLNGLQEVAIQGVITMKNESGVSSLTVTGGTEAGHADGDYSHGDGYKIDIRPDNSDFNSYITTNFTSNGTRSGDASYVKNYGTYTATAVKESNHWDIQFKPN